MNKKSKIIVGILMIYMSISMSFAGFCEKTSSQEVPPKPPICGSGPDFWNNYLSDATSLLSSAENGKEKKTVNALGDKALDTFVGGYEISKSFGTNGLGNFSQNYEITWQDKHIVRDWTKIVNFKKYISRHYLNSASKGSLDQDIEDINKIEQKIKSGKLFLFKTNGRLRNYQDLFEYVWLNQILIEKIFFDEIEAGNANVEEIVRGLPNKTQFTVDMDHAKAFVLLIKQNYYTGFGADSSGKKIECSQSWDEFVMHINNIVCNVGKDKTDEAMERFRCNYDRLKYVLGLGGSEGNCGSEKLKDWVPLEDRVVVNVDGKITEIAQELGKVITDHIPGTVNSAISNMFPTRKDCRTENCGDILYNQNKIDNSRYANQMQVATDQIIQDKNQLNSELSNIESSEFTHNMTKDFPEISQIIWNIREDLDQSDDSIYENTATACENQSPYGKKCRPSGGKSKK